MKILLVLNKPNREIPIMESITREILALRPDAEVEIREMCTPEFRRFVFSYRPDVILTFPFTCEGFSRWYYIFKILFGSKILSLRAEGVVDFTSEYNVAWAVGFDRYGKSLVDYELFWGEKLARAVGERLLLTSKISSMERVKAVGYPRLEYYFDHMQEQPTELPARIKQKLACYNRSNTILFITGFHLANYTRQSLFDAKDLDAGNNLDELLEGVELSKQFRSEWSENIVKTASENPNCLIVVKKHPIEKKEDYDVFLDIGNILFVFEDIQMQDIIPYVGVLFHYGSTALVDAYLSKTPSIYVSSARNKQWYSDLGWPSNLKIQVEGVPAAAKDYLNGLIQFEPTPEINKVLKDIFNIEPGKPYIPSQEIAKILLGQEPPQKISYFDKYLWMSVVGTVYHSIAHRLKVFRQKHSVKTRSNQQLN